MAVSNASPPFVSEPRSEHHEHQKAKIGLFSERYKDKFKALPKEKGWMGENLYMYQGFWYRSNNAHALSVETNAHALSIETTMAMQDSLQSHSTDIYLITQPKSGTTWVKSLMFATVNRAKYKTNSLSTHPLLISNPHNCVPFIEQEFISKTPTYVQESSPRLFSTHLPYTSLPQSILDAGCRLVYLCRNPKDVMVSWFYFSNKFTHINLSPMTMEEMFEVFTKGMVPYGPYWDHVKEYYKASCEHPTKILFLTFEVHKMDTSNQVKRLAEFMGYPFTKFEETEGVVEEIVRLCSLENLKEVNKHGNYREGVPNDVFFRKGEVGGWRNDLTPEMSQILDDITKEKFQGLDISF
ncbi:hypothetical protein L2E82_44594 [Cichorium intybus]|uniref:Uncharacterized protein n=1 Tax=Cichorium intybus TaxID=13427 RepID=A0ACB8ZQW0_CICIN|nr:hypothetical protein L2E82_44594 [Cichorium intybus]